MNKQGVWGRCCLRPAGQAGFTLIEILVVVAILVTLMTIVVRNFTGTRTEAQRDQARLAMGMLDQDLQLYRVHVGSFPPDLQSLVTNTQNSRKWRGPYSESKRLLDPWDLEFGYETDGRVFKLTSAGPDKQMGTADDVIYPEPSEDAPQE